MSRLATTEAGLTLELGDTSLSRGGEAHTPAAELTVAGEATYAPFPQPTTTDEADGYKPDAAALEFTR